LKNLKHGRLAVPVTQLLDLTAELAAGHPVVVLQNLGLPVWHYAVVIGYDLAAGDLILHSGLDARRAIPLGTCEPTWARGDHWGLVVLPPEEVPVAADEVAVLRAATGLEQAGKLRAAATAYAAIAERSPDSLEAWIGLGNAACSTGDLEQAETAFRTAAKRHPNAAAAWNNLAHVLGEQGRRAEAVAAAQRGVRLGGANAKTYRATLREVAGG
jgi:predicted Zn-dependent protease